MSRGILAFSAGFGGWLAWEVAGRWRPRGRGWSLFSRLKDLARVKDFAGLILASSFIEFGAAGAGGVRQQPRTRWCGGDRRISIAGGNERVRDRRSASGRSRTLARRGLGCRPKGRRQQARVERARRVQRRKAADCAFSEPWRQKLRRRRRWRTISRRALHDGACCRL